MTIARLPFYTDSRSKAAFSSLVRGWKFDEYNSTPREVFNRVAATLSGGYTQTQNSGITFNNGTLKATSGIKATDTKVAMYAKISATASTVDQIIMCGKDADSASASILFALSIEANSGKLKYVCNKSGYSVTALSNFVVAGTHTIFVNRFVDKVVFNVDGQTQTIAVGQMAPAVPTLSVGGFWPSTGYQNFFGTIYECAFFSNTLSDLDVSLLLGAGLPTRRYAKWDATYEVGVYYSENDRLATCNSVWVGAKSDIGLNRGKHYYEFEVAVTPWFSEGTFFGMCLEGTPLTNEVGMARSGTYYGHGPWKGCPCVRFSSAGKYTAYFNLVLIDSQTASPIVAGDVFGFAVDFDNHRLDIYRNGTLTISDMPLGRGIVYYPAFDYAHSVAVRANFGQSAFKYEPPDGFEYGWYVDEYADQALVLNAGESFVDQHSGRSWTLAGTGFDYLVTDNVKGCSRFVKLVNSAGGFSTDVDVDQSKPWEVEFIHYHTSNNNSITSSTNDRGSNKPSLAFCFGPNTGILKSDNGTDFSINSITNLYPNQPGTPLHNTYRLSWDGAYLSVHKDNDLCVRVAHTTSLPIPNWFGGQFCYSLPNNGAMIEGNIRSIENLFNLKSQSKNLSTSMCDAEGRTLLVAYGNVWHSTELGASRIKFTGGYITAKNSDTRFVNTDFDISETKPFKWSADIRPTAFSAESSIIGFCGSGRGFNSLYLNNAGQLVFRFTDNSVVKYLTGSTLLVNTDAKVAVVGKNGQLRLLVNDVEVAATTYTNLTVANTPLTIGGNGSYAFQGFMNNISFSRT